MRFVQYTRVQGDISGLEESQRRVPAPRHPGAGGVAAPAPIPRPRSSRVREFEFKLSVSPTRHASPTLRIYYLALPYFATAPLHHTKFYAFSSPTMR